jgi:hypothetical protein
VPFDAVTAQRLCLGELLVFASLGFFIGLLGTLGSYSARWNTVMAARVADARPRSRLPALPRGILVACLFSIIQICRSGCRGFLWLHLPFIAGLLACAVSTTLWLLLAGFVQGSAEQERMARAEVFINDASAPVPGRVPGLESAPRWFRAWNGINIAVFFLLMAQIIFWLQA